MSTASQLIAYLFAKGEPVDYKTLTGALKIDVADLAGALAEAKAALTGSGLELVDDGREVDLRTSAEMAPMVEAMRKEEFSRDLGKAGLETLAVLLYRGPSSRSEIDYVRGVNSTYTLRALTMRGLVRRTQNPKDERSFRYEPTIELLSHLGVTTPSELPDFEDTKRRIAELEAKADETSESEEPATES
jgi:segregation and condensation protein B